MERKQGLLADRFFLSYIIQRSMLPQALPHTSPALLQPQGRWCARWRAAAPPWTTSESTISATRQARCAALRLLLCIMSALRRLLHF